MRVVVTGALGFIGSRVARALAEDGHAIVRASRASTEAQAAGVEVVDLADVRAMAALFAGADAVVHAAGTASLRAPESVLGWLEVAATENVMTAAKHAGVRRFVSFSTTDASLGRHPRVEWSESRSADFVVSRFGRIARAKEDAIIGAGSSRFEPVVLRSGYLYGEGERTRAPELVREARTHGGVRIIGRGLSFVPATYVGNLAHATALALTSGRAAHGIYHVLDRELSSQQPFLSRLSIALGIDLPRRGGPLLVARLRARLGVGDLDEADVLRRGLSTTLDTKRAREDLRYVPRFQQEEGMQALDAWIRTIGGADGLLAMSRSAPDEASIAALRRASER